MSGRDSSYRPAGRLAHRSTGDNCDPSSASVTGDKTQTHDRGDADVAFIQGVISDLQWNNGIDFLPGEHQSGQELEKAYAAETRSVARIYSSSWRCRYRATDHILCGSRFAESFASPTATFSRRAPNGRLAPWLPFRVRPFNV